MAALKSWFYCVQTPDDRVTVVRADALLVDERGALNLWLNRRLVAAFGAGFWMSIVETPGVDDNG